MFDDFVSLVNIFVVSLLIKFKSIVHIYFVKGFKVVLVSLVHADLA